MSENVESYYIFETKGTELVLEIYVSFNSLLTK